MHVLKMLTGWLWIFFLENFFLHNNWNTTNHMFVSTQFDNYGLMYTLWNHYHSQDSGHIPHPQHFPSAPFVLSLLSLPSFHSQVISDLLSVTIICIVQSFKKMKSYITYFFARFLSLSIIILRFIYVLCILMVCCFLLLHSITLNGYT